MALRTTNDGGKRRKIKEDLKFWRKELRERSDAATKAILKRADIVLVTLTSATEGGPIRFLEENHFDMVVIDEVSQVWFRSEKNNNPRYMISNNVAF